MNERDIFSAALDIYDPAERAAYLDRACAGDATLREHIESLLRAHVAPGSFLDKPAEEVEWMGADAGRDDVRSLAESIGSVIAGKYKLLQNLGDGGMGIVDVAEQERPIKRRVAVKLIKPGMDSEQVLRRFQAEEQALALMDHINIAKVLDAGTTEMGRPYFVMELVKGVPLTKYCDELHLPIRERLELFVPVCQAIQHAHQKGIIHRDIKPSNVLVCIQEGRPVPKVIDFGVAKALHQRLTEQSMYTEIGAVIGTLEYMSPEQAELSSLDIDTRADVYCLGVMLYELLTGSTPLDNKRLKQAAYAETLRIIREVEPPKPSTRLTQSKESLAGLAAQRRTEPARLTKDVRGELDWIVMKALEKDRTRRYESASGLARDIERHLADEPVEASPPSVGYRFRKFVRRNRAVMTTIAIVTAALVLGTAVSLWQAIRATYAEGLALNRLTAEQSERERAVRAEGEKTEQLWQALLAQAQASRNSRQSGQRQGSLNALVKAASIRPDERLRDEAIAAMALPDFSAGPSWDALPSNAKSIAFDGLYLHYARSDQQGVITVHTIPENKEVQRIVSGPTTLGSLWLSPNGKFLARLEDGYTLRVWRVADGQPVLSDEPKLTLGWAFSPDSRQLAVGQQGWILCFDLVKGQESNRWRLPGNASAYSLDFHPDCRQLAVGHDSGSVVSVYDVDNGALLTDLAVGASGRQVVAWHPDGNRLAVAGDDPRIQIWDVSAGHRLASLEGHSQYVVALTFHPGGELLASNSYDGVPRLWNASSGRQLMQLPLSVRPQFSTDGRWLGVELDGAQARLLETTSSSEYRTIVSSLGAGKGGYHYGDISHDGRLLALGMDDGTRLWDLHSGRELTTLPGDSRTVCFNRIGQQWELLTSTSAGLLRWPAKNGDPHTVRDGQLLRLGPPRKLSSLYRADFARSTEGGTLTAIYEPTTPIQILDLQREVVRQDLDLHPNGDGLHALSADGRWLASCGWHSDRVRLWNARTGMMVHEWNLGERATVFFTPDSRILVISRGDEYSFWDVDSWQPIRRLHRDVADYPGYVAFAPDGRLMALEMAPAVIHLKEVATGRTIAKLADPHGDRATWLAFTPDGTQLVTAAKFARAIHLWDLRNIRRQLKTLGLDWDWPEFAPTIPDAGLSLKIQVDAGELGASLHARALERQAHDHLQFQQWDQAEAAYAKAIELEPQSARAMNSLAWLLATCPDNRARDPGRALEWARKAVELQPNEGNCRNTLGVAHYRAGAWNDAIAALTKSNELSHGGDSFDWFFLAMGHWKLDQKEQARKWYDQAVQWMEKNAPLHEELLRFRAEAAALLAIKSKR